jgi:hypothetical protein
VEKRSNLLSHYFFQWGLSPLIFQSPTSHTMRHTKTCRNRKRKQSIKKKLVQKAKQIKKTLKKAARAVTA